MSNETKTIKRRFKGKVVSDKMDKTAVVEIVKIKEHPVYKKRFKVTQKVKIHDPKNECQVGDLILFEECRPLSKDKKYRLIKKIEKK